MTVVGSHIYVQIFTTFFTVLLSTFITTGCYITPVQKCPDLFFPSLVN